MVLEDLEQQFVFSSTIVSFYVLLAFYMSIKCGVKFVMWLLSHSDFEVIGRMNEIHHINSLINVNLSIQLISGGWTFDKWKTGIGCRIIYLWSSIRNQNLVIENDLILAILFLLSVWAWMLAQQSFLEWLQKIFCCNYNCSGMVMNEDCLPMPF